MAPGYNRTNNTQLHNIPPMSTSMPHPFRPIHNPVMNPPPVPPRFPMENYTGYNAGYNTGYNPGYNTGYNNYRPYGLNYLNGGFGGLGGYRNYGGYNSGNPLPYPDMSVPNNHGNVVNSFQQYVEETTKPVVSVVESVLSTLSSITAVVESSHFALMNSFRAYESLAHNIGRTRSIFGQLLHTFSLVRLLKWLYKKLRALFGRGKENTIDEMLWQTSMSQLKNETEEHTSMFKWHSSFLFVTVFAIIPYLVFKIMNNVRQIQIQTNNPSTWVKSRHPVPVARALYDFESVSNEELNLKTGQKIWLAPKSVQPKNMPSWLIATNGKDVGLVPNNYVRVTGQLKKSSSIKDEAAAEIMYQEVPQNAQVFKQTTASDNIASENMASDPTS